ncbi:DMT family transporter [Tomitella cavernea]|uniref:DMT family transporter n=1 Tax=Tomitella cavernea TaxID=1387982 RepID=UPI0019084391|nr:SMR family transporter [Tomitella cavernea]
MAGVWLAAAIAAELFATLSLRASRGLERKSWLLPVVLGYVLAFGFLGGALEAGMPIGVAYGIWTATGIAMVALLARAIWGDPLTRRMLVGIGVIAAGVVLVEIG